jgi:hypothetical protein
MATFQRWSLRSNNHRTSYFAPSYDFKISNRNVPLPLRPDRLTSDEERSRSAGTLRRDKIVSMEPIAAQLEIPGAGVFLIPVTHWH